MRLLSARHSRRFEQKVIREKDGVETTMVIRPASESDQPNFEMSAPKLIGRVKNNSLLKTGDVIRVAGPNPQRFLMTNHGSTEGYNVHKLFECNKKVLWERKSTVIDPLTQLEKETGYVEQGTIWVLWQNLRREKPDYSMRIEEESRLVVTGEDVRFDDRLDGQTVKRLNSDVLGLNLLEVQ